jgi:hypothetical protein
MEKITLVWNRPRESSWEVDWIEYLFRNVPHETVENPNHNQYWNNSVIIDTIRWASYHNKYVNELNQKGYNFGLIDLSDELRQGSTSYSQAMFVLRNYYKAGLPEHIVHFPLGYNKGFTALSDNVPAEKRQYSWAFVGNRWDETRTLMRDSMLNVGGGYIYSGSDNDGILLDPKEMSKIYRDSIFVPAPHGWFVIDSFRVTEALEAGCIPIVERDPYWKELYGEDVPFIQIDDWADAPSIVNTLLNDPDQLEEFRQQCYTWWTDIKNDVTDGVEDLVRQMLSINKTETVDNSK